MQVYGADKVWRQLAREGMTVARCTVGCSVSASRTADAQRNCGLRASALAAAARATTLWYSPTRAATPTHRRHCSKSSSALRVEQDLLVGRTTYIWPLSARAGSMTAVQAAAGRDR